ncbi:hypothetical protein C8Q72DRAFT_751989, partial [Fomitopsis betulina]
WHPFESELDWKVGSWAINEEVHKGAVDRLLSIPGVLSREAWFCRITTCAPLQKVDSMPARAEWKRRMAHLQDRPGEHHLVQFRDVIEAIRALLGNPAHAD